MKEVHRVSNKEIRKKIMNLELPISFTVKPIDVIIKKGKYGKYRKRIIVVFDTPWYEIGKSLEKMLSANGFMNVKSEFVFHVHCALMPSPRVATE